MKEINKLMSCSMIFVYYKLSFNHVIFKGLIISKYLKIILSLGCFMSVNIARYKFTSVRTQENIDKDFNAYLDTNNLINPACLLSSMYKMYYNE